MKRMGLIWKSSLTTFPNSAIVEIHLFWLSICLIPISHINRYHPMFCSFSRWLVKYLVPLLFLSSSLAIFTTSILIETNHLHKQGNGLKKSAVLDFFPQKIKLCSQSFYCSKKKKGVCFHYASFIEERNTFLSSQSIPCKDLTFLSNPHPLWDNWSYWFTGGVSCQWNCLKILSALSCPNTLLVGRA